MGAEPVIRQVMLAGGLALPCAEAGDPGGRPVLLLHGYADSLHAFSGLLPALPPGLRAIVPSLRGHGDAGRPPADEEGAYRTTAFAGDVLALLDALGLERAILVGHSMGSLVAQRLAIDHPHRVAGLVLIGAFATLRGNAAVQELWDGSVAGLSDPVEPPFVRAFQESTLAQPVPPDFLDLVVRESLKLPAGIWRAALEGQMAEDTTPDLWRIAAPTLILWGDRDTIALRRDQRLLAAAIPGARLRVVPGAGHGLHWELPALAAAEIAAFAEAVAARADGARAPRRPAGPEDPGALLR